MNHKYLVAMDCNARVKIKVFDKYEDALDEIKNFIEQSKRHYPNAFKGQGYDYWIFKLLEEIPIDFEA